MEIFRKYFVVIILTVIVAIAWGGVVLVSNKTFSTLNPNAENYTKPISPTFNEELLNTISERTRDSFPVLPESFFDLNPD
jgi:hypothetical protein